MAEKPALTPAGRTEAVKLVYDRKRAGIVAIYGTVKDFRPFVEAFRRTFTAEESDYKTARMCNQARRRLREFGVSIAAEPGALVLEPLRAASAVLPR
jgi:hypothetical protein